MRRDQVKRNVVLSLLLQEVEDVGLTQNLLSALIQDLEEFGSATRENSSDQRLRVQHPQIDLGSRDGDAHFETQFRLIDELVRADLVYDCVVAWHLTLARVHLEQADDHAQIRDPRHEEHLAHPADHIKTNGPPSEVGHNHPVSFVLRQDLDEIFIHTELNLRVDICVRSRESVQLLIPVTFVLNHRPVVQVVSLDVEHLSCRELIVLVAVALKHNPCGLSPIHTQ